MIEIIRVVTPRFAVAAIVGAVALAVLAAVDPAYCAAGIVAATIVVAVFRAPHRAVYIYGAALPLVVGINRGALVPGIRVNEALLGLLLLAVSGRFYLDGALRRHQRVVWTRLDLLVITLAVLGSIVPLGFMALRDHPIAFLDLAYALVLPKLSATYMLFRLTVTSGRQIANVLAITVFGNVIAAIVGIGQVLGWGPVNTLLTLYGKSEDGQSTSLSRASSTIGSPLAFADIMTISIALVIACVAVNRVRGSVAFPLIGVLVLATLLSGQVSALLGMVVILPVVAHVLRKWRRVGAGALVTLCAAAPVLAIVVNQRLASIDPTTGLPQAWAGDAGRWINLTTYIWPHFLDGANIWFGVQLAAQLASPYPWTPWLYIESGYTWALWVGGLPLLLCCLLFIGAGLVKSWRMVRSSLDLVSGGRVPTVLGTTVLAGFAQLAILMFFDPHLTYRGSADLLFALLGLMSAFLAVKTSDADALKFVAKGLSQPRRREDSGTRQLARSGPRSENKERS